MTCVWMEIFKTILFRAGVWGNFETGNMTLVDMWLQDRAVSPK